MAPLLDLEQNDDFVTRHIGPNQADIDAMLRVVGIASLEALIDRAAPAAIRAAGPLDLPPGRTEAEVLAALRAMASKNRVMRSMIGMGYHDCFTPGVILRNVLENPGWYTAYTPYQPEISQGRLEVLLAFQTMVMDLTGMNVANASLLDEATAAAEAMTLCRRMGKSKSNVFFAAQDCHPQTLAVLATKSPTSLKVAFRQIRAGASLDFAAAMALEYRLSQRFCAAHDFREGVRAVIIEKDQKPQWQPPDLEAVSAADVDAYFAPLEGGDLLL